MAMPLPRKPSGVPSTFYAVEKKICRSPPEGRTCTRKKHAVRIFDALEAWLAEQLPTYLSKTALAGAIRYAFGRLPRLHPYLSDGQLAPDNNAAERAMCGPPRQGLPLLPDYKRDGRALAVTAPLIGTAQPNRVDHHPWLADILASVSLTTRSRQ